MEFIRRFLQHVLPKNFVKIRYYGFLSTTKRHQLSIVRYILGPVTGKLNQPTTVQYHHCPKCGQPLRLIMKIPRCSRGPPLLLTLSYKLCSLYLRKKTPLATTDNYVPKSVIPPCRPIQRASHTKSTCQRTISPGYSAAATS